MTYTIAVCTVKNSCPKHVEFYSKNKFEKLVHLVVLCIRLYHDARSSERQTNDTTEEDKYIYNIVGPGNLYRPPGCGGTSFLALHPVYKRFSPRHLLFAFYTKKLQSAPDMRKNNLPLKPHNMRILFHFYTNINKGLSLLRGSAEFYSQTGIIRVIAYRHVNPLNTELNPICQ